MIKPLTLCENRGHEFSREIVFHPGGLIGLDSISRAVRFAKSIPVEPTDQYPHFLNLFFRMPTLDCGLNEFTPDSFDCLLLPFIQGTPQHISTSRGKTSKQLANLQDVFLVNDQTKSTFQATGQRGMRVNRIFQFLITSGKM